MSIAAWECVKLIVVRRTAVETYKRLSRAFADDPNVEVVWERRTRERRKKADPPAPERRSGDRRRFTKPWNHLNYFVVHIADEESPTKRLLFRPRDPASRTRR
jgi:hypothetical protein